MKARVWHVRRDVLIDWLQQLGHEVVTRTGAPDVVIVGDTTLSYDNGFEGEVVVLTFYPPKTMRKEYGHLYKKVRFYRFPRGKRELEKILKVVQKKTL